MINAIFSAVRGVRSSATAAITRAFLRATCPAEEKNTLDLCYHAVDQFEQRFITAVAAKDESIWYMAEMFELAIETDVPFNDFAAFFVTGADGDDLVIDHDLTKHAQSYLQSFEKLSVPIRARLLCSLAAQSSKLMHYACTTVEEMADDDDDDFDSRPPPRPS